MSDDLARYLAELAVRFGAMYGAATAPDAHEVVRHELRLACLLDQGLRSYAAQVLDGDTVHATVSARDLGMAETVFWMLNRFGPDVKIVLAAANCHMQRVPFTMPAFELSVAGKHLANRLGDAYVAVAVTSTGGTTTTRRANHRDCWAFGQRPMRTRTPTGAPVGGGIGGRATRQEGPDDPRGSRLPRLLPLLALRPPSRLASGRHSPCPIQPRDRGPERRGPELSDLDVGRAATSRSSSSSVL